MPTSSVIAPALRPARGCTSYLRLAQAILLRRAFEGQRLEAPTQLLFGAHDLYIPVAVLEDIEAHGSDLTLEEGCSHWMPEERPEPHRSPSEGIVPLTVNRAYPANGSLIPPR